MNMKKYVYMALILLVLLSVSAVSAADDQANDIISADDEFILDETIDEDVSNINNYDELILEDNDAELLSSENEEPLCGTDDGTFRALQSKIRAGYGSTITLENDYEREYGFDIEGINITNSITIDGKGHKIDAKGNSRIFLIDAHCNNVIFKNITFLNGVGKNYAGDYGAGGAIMFFFNNRNCLVSNCTFINNSVLTNGGAIYADLYTNLTISDCYFVNNTAPNWGGGIFMTSQDNLGYVFNCTFENNHAKQGGAICSQFWAKIESYSCISKTSSDDAFNVVNHPPTLDVNNITAPYDTGEKVTLNLTTYDGIQLTGTNITINIYYKNNDSWVAKYECLSGDEWQVILPAGAYIANFSTEYTGFGKSISITMTDTTELTATEVTTTYNLNKDLEITLKDSQGNPLSDMEITVDLNGAKNYTTDSNGQIKIPTKDLVAGTYTAEINFTGTEIYLASNASATVTVNRDAPELVAADVTTVYNVNKDLVITLKDSQGNPLSDMEISVDLNGVKNYTTDSNGQIIVPTNDLAAGTYTAEISFAGNENYTDAITHVTVTIIQASSAVTVTVKDIKYGENATANVTLLNGDGNPITGTVNLTITPTQTKEVTIINGEGSVEFEGLAAGNYTIFANYFSNGNYSGSNSLSYFNVEKLASQIVYSDMTTTAVDVDTDGRVGEYFTIALKDSNGKALANKKVQIGFNGKVYDRTTDANGEAKLQINLQNAGIYTFAISFLGDENYNGSFAVAKITVNKQKGSLTVPNKSYAASAKTKSLTATFKSAKGKVVAGKKVSFTVNGKTYSATTNAKGVATVKVSLNKKGTYKVTAKFAGNNMYAAITKTAKLTIK